MFSVLKRSSNNEGQVKTVASDLDIFGEMLVVADLFAGSGFNPQLTFDGCEFLNPGTTADTIFTKESGRWFMRFDVLPGDPAVKAIAVDSQAVYVETATFDAADAESVIRQQMLPLRWDSKKRLLEDTTRASLSIAMVKTAEMLEMEIPEGLSARWLWIIRRPELDIHRRMAVYRFLDVMLNERAFRAEPDAEGEHRTVLAGLAMELRVNMGLRMSLVREQRAVLTLGMTGTVTGRGEMRTELQQLLRMESAILRMDGAELRAFAERDTSPEGQRRAYQVLFFALTRKVRDAAVQVGRPGITWRDARILTRNLLKKG